SLSRETDPSTHEPGYWGVHAIGKVWVEIFWAHSFSGALSPHAPNAKRRLPEDNFCGPEVYDLNSHPFPLVPMHGNTLFLWFIVQGMKLQPCAVSFFDAHTVTLHADEALTVGGKKLM
ncbi:hypothetical protein SCLCIDRAFT_119139, partial [Scleroderma citrinum Foug A]